MTKAINAAVKPMSKTLIFVILLTSTEIAVIAALVHLYLGWFGVA